MESHPTIPSNHSFYDVPASFDINSLIKEAKLDYSRPIPQPPLALRVGDIPFGCLGGFSLIIGKAKSKKTFLATMMMAAALSDYLGNNAFQGELPDSQSKVVFIDTEQARHDVQKVADRVKRLCNSDISNRFDVYALRPFSAEQRLEMIDTIIESTEDVGFLVIDGARDIIQGINDDKTASDVAGKFLQWSATKNMHITTVLHQNKSDNNARGHIGTELINKAETVVSVKSQKTNNNISIVRAEYCRDQEFEQFAFSVDEEGLPKLLNNYITSKVGRNRTSPENLSSEDHEKIIKHLREIFEDSKFKYNSLIDALVDALADSGLPNGKNKAKEFAKYYESQDELIRKGKPRSPSAYFLLN